MIDNRPWMLAKLRALDATAIITPALIAHWINRSPKTVRHYIVQGILPRPKKNTRQGRVEWTTSELADWFDDEEQPAMAGEED